MYAFSGIQTQISAAKTRAVDRAATLIGSIMFFPPMALLPELGHDLLFVVSLFLSDTW
jgi:hypothetical protein